MLNIPSFLKLFTLPVSVQAKNLVRFFAAEAVVYMKPRLSSPEAVK